MTRFIYPICYSFCLVGILAAVSYCVYWIPSQVALRLEEGFKKRQLAVEIEGCHKVDGETTAGKRLRILGSFARRSGPLLELEDFQITSGSSDLGGSAAWFCELNSNAGAIVGGDSRSGGEVQSHRVVASRLRLQLQHQELSAWNFADVLAAMRGDTALDHRFLGRAETFEVAIATPRKRWQLSGSDFRAAGWFADGVVALKGALATAGAWEGGHFECLVSILSPKPWGKGSLRNFSRLEEWLPLLPESFSGFERSFRPRGLVDVDFSFGLRNALGQSPDSVSAVVKHFDSTFRLQASDVVIEKVSGAVGFGPEGFRFGFAGRQPDAPLRGILAGREVLFRGESTRDSGVTRLLIPRMDLRALPKLANDLIGPVGGNWLRTVGMEGEARTELRLVRQNVHPQRQTWNVELASSMARSRQLPLVSSMDFRWAGQGDEKQGHFEFHLDPLRLAGLGAITGQVDVDVGPEKVVLSLPDEGLRMAEPPGARRRFSQTTDESGTITGQITIGRGVGSIDGTLVGRRLLVRIAAAIQLAVEELRLNLASEDSGFGSVTAEFSGAAVEPKELCWGHPWSRETNHVRYDRGGCQLHLLSSGVRVDFLNLSGPAGALRFQGDLSWDGRLTGLAVVVEKVGRSLLTALPAMATPASWRSAVAATGSLLQVSGTLAQPDFQELPWTAAGAAED